MRKVQRRKIRLVIAKPGLDGHDRGAKVLARGLRDAGFEVIYTGLHQTPEDIVETVVQEDPHALLLSCLSGAHNVLFPKIMEYLEEEGIDDVLVLGGGIIPEEDAEYLRQKGISGVFGPGTKIQEVTKFILENLKR